MKYFVDKMLSFFGAKNCYGCAKPGYYFCPDCLNSQPIFDSSCYVCKKKSEKFCIHPQCTSLFIDKIIVLVHYKNGPLKKLLWDAKYYKVKAIYHDFVEIAVKNIKNNIDEETLQNTVLTYPPMHFFRKWKRGYNQSEYFATKIGKSLQVPVLPLLKKVKYTPHQSHLTKVQREKNLKQSFSIQKRYIPFIVGKNIILIDDVVSTGTTLNESAKILQAYGAQRVSAFAIASD